MAAKLAILAVIGLAFVIAQVQRSAADERRGWPVAEHVERDGLILRTWLAGGRSGFIVEVAVENRRDRPVYLVPDQCGRVSEAVLEHIRPAARGRVWSGSVEAVKRLVLESRAPSPERFAPRRSGDDSNAVPECTSPTGPIALAPGAHVRERWARPYAPVLDGANKRIAIEIVEAKDPAELELLDVVDDRDDGGRDLRIETEASALTGAALDPPDRGLSPGEQFDRLMEDDALRAAIAGQPADSWVHADLIAGNFKAISRRFERAFTAMMESDGAITVRLPSARDRARRFPTRRPTLPPGVELRAGTPSRDVMLGDLVLPSGRVVTDDVSGGGPDKSRFRTAPGRYPVHVTLAGGRVALATLTVSDRAPVTWRHDGGVAVDGGTAAFTSPEAEAALNHKRDVAWLDDAFDSITAHDYIGTEFATGDGTNFVLFSTGFGDGRYRRFVGLDEQDRPVRYVLDFRVLDLLWRG